MKISVEKIYDKGVSEINEDELLIKDNIFAVFDGAYSNFKENGKTGGKIAAEVLKATFSKNEGTLMELGIEANEKLFDKMKKAKVDFTKKSNLCMSTAAVVRIRQEQLEYFQVGDSLILLIYKDGTHRLLTEYYDQDIPVLVEWKRHAKLGEKNIKEKVFDKIMESRTKINIEFGVINGEREAVNFFKTGKVKPDDIKHIILFTDGLLLPKEDPEAEEDWNTFVEIYKKSGLNGLLKYVRNIEDNDPKNYTYPRTKQHDDISAIAITLD